MRILIPDYDRDIIEQVIYLPMLISILEKDLKIIENTPFKLKGPYLDFVENTLKTIRIDLRDAKTYMYKNKIKVFKVQSDENFTMYRFIYKGHEEDHSYFNPALKTRSDELLRYYFNNKNKPLS